MSYSSQSFGIPVQAQSITKTSTNNTGSAIGAALPVKITATGMATINPTLEADVLSLAGLTVATVGNGSQGTIIASGTIYNVGMFSPGDAVFVSLSGGLTNDKPDIGVDGFVEGDWVVRVGFIVKNETTPSQLDLLVAIAIIGQL